MYGHLAVGLDGSLNGGSALELALQLGKRLGSVVHGIHVIDAAMLEGSFIADITGALGVEPLVNLTASVESVLSDLADTIRTRFSVEAEEAGVTAQFQVVRGAVAPSLVAASGACGLLLVGKQGVNAKYHGDLMGPVVERLLRLTTIPVLVTPTVPAKLERLLIAYDGGAKADHAMRVSGELARALSLPVAVVVVADDEDAARPHAERARAHLEPLGLTVRVLVEKGPAAEAIERARGETSADLVCMGAHSRGRLAEMVLGSTAEMTIRRSPVPVLCAP